jgi:hypothetical protein
VSLGRPDRELVRFSRLLSDIRRVSWPRFSTRLCRRYLARFQLMDILAPLRPAAAGAAWLLLLVSLLLEEPGELAIATARDLLMPFIVFVVS